MIDTDSPRSYIARHGVMRFLGEFTPDDTDEVYQRGDLVILRSERGQEVGEILRPAVPEALKQLADPTHGTIVRLMTPADRAQADHQQSRRMALREKATNIIVEHRLDMLVVDVEPLFGAERVVIYFLSEKRIDFRELVKALAREFQARIELRQIGVRDEAKLKADYGDCGKPVCCNTHMSVMPPVSMRMAKIQKSTLDPAKISGRCGRLKCCLRFEQDVYDEHMKELPAIGTRVVTAKGQGRVLGQEILARKLLVEFEDGRRQSVSVEEVLTRLGKSGPREGDGFAPESTGPTP